MRSVHATAISPISPRAAARLAAIGSLAAALVLAVAGATVEAQTPGVAPARATVYVRLVGDLELVRPADMFGAERRIQRSNVELSTGSGVLISPVGHVLTAAHVVTAEAGTLTLGGVRMEMKQTVRRLEVFLPAEEGSGQAPGPLEATILAVDPALDLAIVTVSGSGLPFVDLGDSDALVVGDQVEAIGFPFGDQVEIGRPSSEVAAAPSPSVSRGNVSAFRGDAAGDRRYLQVTASLNPGNSGGPIVDGDGYLVAIANSVMRSRAGLGSGVGFGVPVNLVKRFLELNSVDGALRARRMAAGSVSPIEGKGLRVALPVGMTDASPMRARVDTGSQPDGVSFRIDRVVSPWPLARIESALTAGQAFEAFTASAGSSSRVAELPAGRLVIGRVTGLLGSTGEGGAGAGEPARIEYALAERGAEKVVARFVGPAYQLAYNASVIRGVLQQVEVEPLRVASRGVGGAVTWMSRAPARGTPLDRLKTPAGWLLEAVGPFSCAGVPPPSDAFSASPPGDFVAVLRAGWIPGAGVSAQAAAAACGTPRADDPSSYGRDVTFLGTRYLIEGRFELLDDAGLLQTETVAPADQAPALRALSWPRL